MPREKISKIKTGPNVTREGVKKNLIFYLELRYETQFDLIINEEIEQVSLLLKMSQGQNFHYSYKQGKRYLTMFTT